MRFTELEIAGVYLVELDKHMDERGFFARSWCEEEFENQGLNSRLSQCNLSYNYRKGTLRGMHMQRSPFEEAKLVRCIKGSIYDVVLDLRDQSPTKLKWIALELTSEERNMIYIPEGCAHGYQTLEDDTELFYQMSTLYNAESSVGFRWDDPAFQIYWPVPNPIMNDKDRSYRLLEEVGDLHENHRNRS
jgi:dTDP-4-dehydrorhamnose 3,5-epimerase